MKVALPKVADDGDGHGAVSRAVFGAAVKKHGAAGVSADGGKDTSAADAGGSNMLSAFKDGHTQDMTLLINKPPKWNEGVSVETRRCP